MQSTGDVANTETLTRIFTAVYQKRIIKAFFLPSTQKYGEFSLDDSLCLRLGVLDEEGVLQLWEWAESDYCWVTLGKCSLIPKPDQLAHFAFDPTGRYLFFRQQFNS